MTGIDWLFIVLYYINLCAIILVTLQFVPQALFYLFFWLPRRHFKPTDDYKRVAIIIAAHNEEEVIYHTVNYLKQNLDYPKDLYDVYVCAHNCNDKTAQEAERAGAHVYILNDHNPKHRFVAYPLKHMLSKMLEENVPFDFVIRLDADNLPCKTFLKEMNNSIHAGCKIVRAYEAAKNFKQNLWSQECAIFYIKDSRVQNTFRQFVHSTSMMPGPGLTMTRDVVEKMGGWDCMTAAEDAEFTFNRLFDGYKIYFNTDAIVYEDQPSTYHDTKKRLTRLGSSLTKLFFTDGWKMFVCFFRTGNPMYLDMLLQIGFNPISVMCFTWFPLYYATYAILMLCGMSGVQIFSNEFFTYNLYSLGNIVTLQPTANIIFTNSSGQLYSTLLWHNTIYTETMGSFNAWASSQAFYGLLQMAVQVIIMLAAFCIFQSFIAIMMDHKKLGLSWKLEGTWKGIILSPLFTLVYGLCNVFGALGSSKWIVAKRNTEFEHLDLPLPTKEKIKYFTLSERELRRYDGHWWKKR